MVLLNMIGIYSFDNIHTSLHIMLYGVCNWGPLLQQVASKVALDVTKVMLPAECAITSFN